MLRTILFIGILVGAAGLPIVLTGQNEGGTGESRAQAFWQQLTGSGHDSSVTQPSLENLSPQAIAAAIESLPPLPGASSGGPSLVGPPGVSLPELLRFDISPQWLQQNWPRVSTGLAELDLHAMRVPVVTGTELHSFAGSATYCFDRSGQLQRILLHGFTGDIEPTLALLEQQFQFQPLRLVAPVLFVSRREGEPIHLLRLRSAPVTRAETARAKYEILLELNAAGEPIKRSAEFEAVLAENRDLLPRPKDRAKPPEEESAEESPPADKTAAE